MRAMRSDVEADQRGVLNSWKEIAAHFGRDVTTVQRWERSRRLPVHRIPGGKRGAVYARIQELEACRLGGEEQPAGSVLPDDSEARLSRATVYRTALAVIVTAAVVVCWRLLSVASNPPVRFLPLASLPGNEVDPAFSADGSHVAFSFRPEGGSNFDIYVKAVGQGQPLRLTSTPENERCPQFSPDSSQLAFLRTSSAGAGLWVIGASGGGERKIATVRLPKGIGDPGLAWSIAGDSLVVSEQEADQGPAALYSIDVASGRKRRLTQPPPDVISDAAPVFSRSGELLAFTRQSPSRVREIWVMPARGGEPRPLTRDQRNISGLAWTEGGQHLLFLSSRGGPGAAVWKLPARGGQPQFVTALPAYSAMLAVAPRGGRIAYTDFEERTSIWRFRLDQPGVRADKPERLITASGIQATPEYSPDGSSIAFMSDRSGFMEIWVARADGSSPRQLTWLHGEGGAPRWSPDSKRIAFDMRVQGDHGIFVVDGDGGPAVRVVADRFENGAPSWSRDGRWIYFLSNRTGTHHVWKIPAGGGSAVQVTRDGGAIAFESPEGAVLYYGKGRWQRGLWKKTLPAGEEVPVLPDYAAWVGAWRVGSRGIYFLDRENRASPASQALRLLPYGGGPAKELLTLNEAAYPASYAGGVSGWHPLSVSPDGTYVLMTQLEHRQSNIMIAEGVH